MADTTTVVEGKVKFRDGRKWKPRWCVLKKPSPVADRLQVLLYKDVREAIRDGCKPKSCFPIENFYGLQSGFTYEKENNIMAIICHKQVTLFSFENREDLIQFEIKIRRSLGEEHQFPVRIHKMPSHSKLPQDLIRLHIHGQKFCFTSNVPPKILQCWQISDLRRFGNVDGKFLFEGGSRCNKGAGLHALMSEQIEDIGEIIRLAAMGKTRSCQKMSNKRGSQFSDAFDSFNTFSSLYNNNPMRVGGHPTVLHYCNDTNLNEVDEMGFHKRHSISVMDYRRMAGLSEKFRQMGMENLERQRMMATYDIPVRFIKEVCKQNSAPTNKTRKPNTNRYSVSCSELKPGNIDLSHFSSNNLSQSFNNHIYTNTLNQSPSNGASPPPRPEATYENSPITRYAHNYQKNKPLTINPLCIIEDEARTAFDQSKRLEAMQKLQKQENDLHKEISLLDEILLVCKSDDPATQKANAKNLNFSEKSASLPNKPRKESLTDQSFSGPLNSVSSSAEGFEKLQSGNLNVSSKPVIRTKISAPLPYVNLSQFDLGEDNGHVHLSKEGLVTGSSSRSLSKSPVGNLNIKKSTESLNSNRSLDSHSHATRGWIREPIYANESVRPETPPPELPPKGPALLRKNRLSRNFSSFSQVSGTPPPLPPSRNRSRSVGSQSKGTANGLLFDEVVPLPAQPRDEETYLMMGDFKDELKPRKKSLPVVSKGNADVVNCYMDMAAVFQKEISFCGSKSLPEETHVNTESPIYDTIGGPTEQDSKLPIRESNYMVMEASKSNRNNSSSEEANKVSVDSNSPIIIKKNSVIQRLQTLQTYVSTTKAGEPSQNKNVCRVTPKPLIPFENLLEFKPQHVTQAGVYVSSVNIEDSATPSPEPCKKDEGFLARFKRRNSKDQKACQSTENLLSTAKKSGSLEKSHSEDIESIVTPSNSSPLKSIRQRSSSFPNRRSYQEEDTIPLVTESCKADSFCDDVFPNDDSNNIHYETYLSKSSIQLHNGEKSEIEDEVNKETRVITVMHVQHDPPAQNIYTKFESSKTDDEKIIALLNIDKPHPKKFSFNISDLKSKLSLPLGKSLHEHKYDPNECPKEQAPPIPPFLPPKTRVYPTLSPVVEMTPTTPQCPDSESIYVLMRDPAPPIPAKESQHLKYQSSSSQQGTKQADTLQHPSESSTIEKPPDNSGCLSAYERALLVHNRIVVSVEDLRERLERDDDLASLSSNEYLDTKTYSSLTCEESSPSKTVLRPRSGKEYKIVVRRTALSESSNSPSSPTTPTTPNSPNSVFTFDIHEPGASNIEGTGTIRSPALHKSKSNKSDDSAPSSPWIPIPNKCLKNHLSSSRVRHESLRMRMDSVSNSDSATAHRSDSVSRKSTVSRRKSESSSRNPKRRSSSSRSKQSVEKSHSRRTRVSQVDSDSELDSINLSLIGGKSDRVTYKKDVTSSSALRLVDNGDGENNSVYLQLWDTKAGKSNSHSPKASVSSDPSPPVSPQNTFLQPLAPISDDQEELNYAEMDLVSPNLSLPKKSVPKSQSNTIEYTSIDLIATEALKAAGKEHAQDRSDSLRRSKSVLYNKNLSYQTSMKERKGSLSFGRDRKYSSSSVDFRS